MQRESHVQMEALRARPLSFSGMHPPPVSGLPLTIIACLLDSSYISPLFQICVLGRKIVMDSGGMKKIGHPPGSSEKEGSPDSGSVVETGMQKKRGRTPGSGKKQQSADLGSVAETSTQKKRGRPRKKMHSADSDSVAEAGMPMKRGPGAGSGKKQQLKALGPPGTQFTPYVFTVDAGEDVASKVRSCFKNEHQIVFVISANGPISKATLHQGTKKGGPIQYEGNFELLSLNHSFNSLESGSKQSQTGEIHVTLADVGNPGCHVFRGQVAGTLIAASPIQVVVGSFRSSDPMSTPARLFSSEVHQQTQSEISGSPGSPIIHSPDSQGISIFDFFDDSFDLILP